MAASGAISKPQFGKYLYHETHRDNRENIRAEGLIPGSGQRYLTGTNAPAGTYLSPHNRSEYGSSMHDASWYGQDRWRVNVEGLEIHPDPTQPKSAMYTPSHIPPERLTLAKKGHPDWEKHI